MDGAWTGTHPAQRVAGKVGALAARAAQGEVQAEDALQRHLLLLHPWLCYEWGCAEGC